LHVLQRRFAAAAALFAFALAAPAWGQVTGTDQADTTARTGLLGDIEAYATAPLRWRGQEWTYFGATLAAVGVAHHYDGDVRTHFTRNSPAPLNSSNSHDLQDYAPAAVALGGTWLYATWLGDYGGRREAWAMAEAAGLGVATDFVLKFAAGRERPDETTDPNRWRRGGSSFPSNHVTIAFAIGTVLAESGSDDYRWIRRFLGYGIGFGAAYARLDHNAHWLSDEVASAALGTATAYFVMNRTTRLGYLGLSLVPLPGGAMLSYRKALP
jgi:membrane-associated phospholipid phosphatase